MAIKRLFRKAKKAARSAVGAPGRAIAGAYYDSKTRMHKKKSDQVLDDIKTVRQMTKSGVERGSPQDPMSRGRREMRINDFKNEMDEKYGEGKKKKRLFRKK